MTKIHEKTEAYRQIGVVGAGSWGTALALVAARAGGRVMLWAREADVVDSITRQHENALFLPNVSLPNAICATNDLAGVAKSDALLLVVPAQHLRATLRDLAPHLKQRIPVILCAKGIELGSGKLVTEILREEAPQCEAGILSGPSFARDVAAGLPTAVTIAARVDIARKMQAALGHAAFRPYASDDIVGVALGGAAKNVYAISCGIVSGMGLGESARAALLSRGFAELIRLGEALGASRDTLMGLSGLGDLVLTATSPTSRNFSFGLALGKGQTRADIDRMGHPLAEGVATAPALVARARQEGIELPIAEAVADVLAGTLALDAALPRLMSRPLTKE